MNARAKHEGLVVGEVLDGRYRIEAKIGYGAFGQVYRGEDTDAGRAVAIKLFNDSGAESGYLRELGLLFSEHHRRIVETYGFGYSRGRRYIAYEYVGGGSLRDFLVRSPRLHPRVALGIIAQVGEGIAFAHRRRVVHRDLKPENILLESPDWPTGAKLCDFGLSTRWREGDAMRSHYGSPAYMAPEQLVGEYDHRVDYYAMGVMLYEMLFGNRPFGGSVESIRRAQARGDIELPRGLNAELRAVLGSLLAHDPEGRPSDSAAMEAMIARAVRSVEAQSSGAGALASGEACDGWEKRWEARVDSPIETVASTVEGNLLAFDGSQILEVEARGDLQLLVGARQGLDGFVEGGSVTRDEIGWHLDGKLWRYRGGRVEAMEGDYELPMDATRSIHLPGEEAVLVVTPSHLEAVEWGGDIRWRASFQSYGSVPAVAVGGVGGHIALACEVPRTQLIGLDYQGHRLFRTAAQANDPLLVCLGDGSTVVGARSMPQVRRFDAQGFLVNSWRLGRGVMGLEAMGERYLWARGREGHEAFDVARWRRVSTAKWSGDPSLMVACGEGLYEVNSGIDATILQRFELNHDRG